METSEVELGSGLSEPERHVTDEIPTSRLRTVLVLAAGTLLASGVVSSLTMHERSPNEPYDTAIVVANGSPPSSLPEITTTTTLPETASPTTVRPTSTTAPPTTTPHRPMTTAAPKPPGILHAAAVPQPNTNLPSSIFYGVDVSWPKDNCSIPSSVLHQANYVIAGIDNSVNNSHAFNSSPAGCFLSEATPAKRLELYAFPEAPVNATEVQQHALTGPQKCQDMTTTPVQCAYNFGYNYGAHDANFIIDYLPLLNAKQWNRRLWLDIENCDPSCYTTNAEANTSAIVGFRDGAQAGFDKYGKLVFGLYSTKTIEESLTGGQVLSVSNFGPDVDTWIATGAGQVTNLSTYSCPYRKFGNPILGQIPIYQPNKFLVDDGAHAGLDYDMPVGEITALTHSGQIAIKSC